jgi:hypothetical protein
MTVEDPPRGDRRLVLVSGAGRSGTSTVAGALKYLGYHVPPPELGANDANPRGYFEPRWAINFHKRLLNRAGVHTMDARPDAPLEMNAAIRRPAFRRQLRGWLSDAFEQSPQVVVKDPRAFWARDLCLEAAAKSEAEASFLTMLRHPAEVVGSRDAYYMAGKAREQRAAREISHLAGWINATLINEYTSRGHRRAFLQYEDLLADWRGSMSAISDTLDLQIPTAQFTGTHHPIDDFIDVSLHRVHVTWQDMVVPEHLEQLAGDVWSLLTSQRTAVGEFDEATMTALDQLRERYRALYLDAVALSHDEIQAVIRRTRRETRKKVEEELAQQAAAHSDEGHTGSEGTASSPTERSPSRRNLSGWRSGPKRWGASGKDLWVATRRRVLDSRPGRS